MNESQQKQPCKIYKFPNKINETRRVVESGHGTRQVAITAGVALVDYGSAWYHDVAVRDDRATRKP